MRHLELQTRVVDKSAHVRLQGDIEFDNAEILRQTLLRDVPSGARTVFLDIGGVRRLDTAGVAVLVDFAARLAAKGGRVHLQAVSAAVMGMLELLGAAAGVFHIHSRLENAHNPPAGWRMSPARLHDPTVKLTTG